MRHYSLGLTLSYCIKIAYWMLCLILWYNNVLCYKLNFILYHFVYNIILYDMKQYNIASYNIILYNMTWIQSTKKCIIWYDIETLIWKCMIWYSIALYDINCKMYNCIININIMSYVKKNSIISYNKVLYNIILIYV